jgi:hypothetical protein
VQELLEWQERKIRKQAHPHRRMNHITDIVIATTGNS